MLWILLALCLALLVFMDFRVWRATYRWIFARRVAGTLDNGKDQMT